jgi:hypothetical protein
MPTIYFDVENESNKINMQTENSPYPFILRFWTLLLFHIMSLMSVAIGDHVKDDLTKFGYRLDMKV